MASDSAQVARPREVSRRIPSWFFRSPVWAIIRNPKVERLVAAFVWVALAFELYTLMHIPGGLAKDYFVTAAIVALASIVLIYLFIASFAPRAAHRQWIIAAVSTWSAAAILLAVSTMLGAALNPAEPVHHDLLDGFLRPWLEELSDAWPPLKLLLFSQHPSMLSIYTFLIHFAYGLFGAVVLNVALRSAAVHFQKDASAGQTPRVDEGYAPPILGAAALAALAMTLTHSFTRW